MFQFVIRPAEQKDLERLSYLYSQGFPGYDYEPVQFENYLNNYGNFLFVSIHREVVVGYILGDFNITESYCHIASLAVHSFYRRKGIGRSLMQDIFEKSIQQKVTEINLNVLVESLPAVKLYQSLGFIIKGRFEGEEGKTFLQMKVLLANLFPHAS